MTLRDRIAEFLAPRLIPYYAEYERGRGWQGWKQFVQDGDWESFAADVARVEKTADELMAIVSEAQTVQPDFDPIESSPRLLVPYAPRDGGVKIAQAIPQLREVNADVADADAAAPSRGLTFGGRSIVTRGTATHPFGEDFDRDGRCRYDEMLNEWWEEARASGIALDEAYARMQHLFRCRACRGEFNAASITPMDGKETA